MTLINVVLTLLFASMMAIGQIILNKASAEIFSKTVTFKLIITNSTLLIGLLIYAVNFVFWLYILSRFDVRYAYPLSATAIFFLAFFSSVLNSTPLPSTYWFGLVIVFVGLVTLSLSLND